MKITIALRMLDILEVSAMRSNLCRMHCALLSKTHPPGDPAQFRLHTDRRRVSSSQFRRFVWRTRRKSTLRRKCAKQRNSTDPENIRVRI